MKKMRRSLFSDCQCEHGFTLVEILIVIAVIAVIAALTLPTLLSSKKAANEASAIASLRTIAGAAKIYAKRYHSAPSLEKLAEEKLIDAVLGSGTKSGYNFEMNNNGGKDWHIIASPVSWGSTGDRRFKINWMQQILYTTQEDDISVANGAPLGAGGGK